MASVIEVEKLFKKGASASAGIQQSSYSWGLTCPPALSATPRPRRSTRYKYITAMLVKVTKLENKAHAGYVWLYQDFMALDTKYEIEVTTDHCHFQPVVNVSSSLLCSGLTEAMERYEYTTAMLIRVENTTLARRWWSLQVPLLLNNYYQALNLIVPGT